MLKEAKGLAMLAPDGGVQVDGSAPARGATGKVHHVAVRALLAGPILGEERADLGLAARSLSATLRVGFGFDLRFGLGLAATLGSRARRGRVGRILTGIASVSEGLLAQLLITGVRAILPLRATTMIPEVETDLLTLTRSLILKREQ